MAPKPVQNGAREVTEVQCHEEGEKAKTDVPSPDVKACHQIHILQLLRLRIAGRYGPRWVPKEKSCQKLILGARDAANLVKSAEWQIRAQA